ncbi:LysR family transcriptional regulator [Kitasatospora aureofaciens]|uniref:LysR family transcriptional regulator n=1 Tax=Kitasatospora aureofaciens TaxID=1894 RepID=UPI001C450303|nr:LysR family transcriptional regulator [Kitasatospora aureofaciens]MBV6702129.1 LysR family transcriptional regulator [Kitasatospora aureofaciens]
MELRQLRYFQAVAEEGNLTRAAQRLYLSAPSLSQQIRLLEKELGAPLFERAATGMTLTPAGTALVPEAKAALDAAERARHAVESATRTEPAVLRIGVPAGVPAALVRCVRDASAALRQAGVPARIRFRDAPTAAQLDLLASGDLDLGLLTTPFPATDLRTATVWREPMGVVTGHTHPLARLDTVGFADLAGQELLWFPREFAPGHHDEVLAHCRRNGWDPHLRAGSGHRSVFQTQLTSGEPLVAVQPASMVADDPHLTWRPFTREAPTLTLAAAWRPANPDPALRDLVLAVQQATAAGAREHTD